MRAAYLIQHPKVSHSFIRRAIPALERAGVTVDRRPLAGAIGGCSCSQSMRSVTPDLWPHIRVVHCGFDDADFTPPPPADAGFLCAARLNPEKGHLVLFQAFTALQRDHPQISLTLAGDGDLRPTIKARITASGLAVARRITGW